MADHRRALVLTLGIEDAAQARFDALRTRHFPPERNFIPAHVTLFHALPGLDVDAVARDVQAACAAHAPFQVAVTGLRPLGRGVAYELRSSPLSAVRTRLARQWHGWLTPQDAQGYRPHLTIQNKATPEAARALLDAMRAAFVPFEFAAQSLLLWRYLGGPWEALGRYPFRSEERQDALPS